MTAQPYAPPGWTREQWVEHVRDLDEQKTHAKDAEVRAWGWSTEAGPEAALRFFVLWARGAFK